MADENLEVVITATDKASSVFRSVANVGNKILGVGLVGGFTALAGGIGLAVKEASNAQDIMAQTAAVIESTGAAAGLTGTEIADLATQLSAVTTFEDDAIQAGENMLLTFTNIGKDTFPTATQTMLDMSQALGQDITSSAMQLGKALNDPIKGVTALRRIGVQLTDQQEAQVKAMVEAGDVAGAQALILAELQREFGGSAKAAGETFAGQMARAKNATSNMAEGVGTALLPVLQKLMEAFMTFLPTIQGVIDKIGLFITGTLIPFVTAHGPLIIGVIKAIGIALAAAAIVSVIVSIVSAIGSFVGAIGGVIATVSAVIPIIASVAAPILLIIGAIALLVIAWKNNWGGIQDKVKAVWDFLQPIFQAIIEWVRDKIGVALTAAKTFWENVLLPALRKVWDFIEKYVIPVVKVIVNIIGTVLKIAIQIIVIEIKIFIAILQKVWEWFKDHILPILEKVWSFIVEKLGPIFKWLSEKVFQPLVDLIWGGLKKALDWILDKFQKISDFFSHFKLPDWLTPGSPTPFELGLMGINKQLTEMASSGFSLGGVTMTGRPSLGSSPKIVQIVYSPTFSTASRDELEFKLRPVIESIVRDLA